MNCRRHLAGSGPWQRSWIVVDRPAENRGSAYRHDGCLTSDRLDELFQHCADIGIDVEWADLGEHRRGEYRHYERRIVLNRRLSRAQLISTLAHEIAHAKFGDTCSTDHAERRAWQYAAAFLITPAQYATAERLVGHHPAALAVELGVTRRVIESWCDWWKSRGRHLRRRDVERGLAESE